MCVSAQPREGHAGRDLAKNCRHPSPGRQPRHPGPFIHKTYAKATPGPWGLGAVFRRSHAGQLGTCQS